MWQPKVLACVRIDNAGMTQSLDSRSVVVVLNDLAKGSQSVTSASSASSSKCHSLSTNKDETKTLLNNVQNQEQNVSSEKSQQIAVTMIAGAMAGAMAKTTIAPLDRTKINFQATNKKYSLNKAIKFTISSYKNEGLLSLWRGNSATMARIIPYSSIQFTAHDQWKRILGIQNNGNPETWKRFLAGSLAGVTSQSLTYPLDMARARMAVTQKNTYSSLTQVFVKIWKNEGPLKLYRGLTPTILGVIPYAGTSFGTYESLKHYHKTKTNDSILNPFERMMFGAIAGIFGQSSSYPLDIVRRRMQTATVTGNGNSYNTIMSTLLKVYREEGVVHGLYKGLSLNFIKGPLAVGISFATFDTLKLSLEQLMYAR